MQVRAFERYIPLKNTLAVKARKFEHPFFEILAYSK